MPSIAGSILSGNDEISAVRSDSPKSRAAIGSVRPKRRSTSGSPISPPSPMKWKSPRRCLSSTPKSSIVDEKDTCEKAVKKLLEFPVAELEWNPKDPKQVSAVKEVLHVSKAPSEIVCREEEQNRVFEFCKTCVEQAKAGSLYICGCPGTGKSLSVDKVKGLVLQWAKETGRQPVDVLSITCTSSTNTSEIFGKILGHHQQRKRSNASVSPLRQLQNLYSKKEVSSAINMTMVIADELDYLITKDRAVLNDLFMLTTLPFSRCILIGIANAIDLADRFLPRLQSADCKPLVITFRAYSKDQILRILQQRLAELPYPAFHPQALELCSRKLAAASGDMRKALCVCRSAVEVLEADHIDLASDMTLLSDGNKNNSLQSGAGSEVSKKQGSSKIVRVDHMAVALSKAFKSPVVDTIQSLPQHQQIIICSAVKLFRKGKKDTTLGELNKSYMDICRASLIPPVGTLELSSMCRVLSDQGLLKLGQARDEKLRRVTLRVDEEDITFALQGVHFFRNCLL